MLPGFMGSGFMAGGKPLPYVIGSNSVTTNSTNLTVPLPTYQAGDILVVCAAKSHSSQATSFAVPSGWTTVVNEVVGNNLRRVVAFAKIATGSEGTSVVLSGNNGSSMAGLSFSVRRAKAIPVTSVVSTIVGAAIDLPAVSLPEVGGLFVPVTNILSPGTALVITPPPEAEFIRYTGQSAGTPPCSIHACGAAADVVSADPGVLGLDVSKTCAVFTLGFY
jgi:hypothetical protein